MSDLSSTASGLRYLSSTGGSGGVLDVFYEDWKLYLNQHPKIVAAMKFVENGGIKSIITEASKLEDKSYGSKITLHYES